MDCQGIFFDLYGTLLLYGDMRAGWDDWLASFHAHARAAGLEIERDRLGEALTDLLERPAPSDDTPGRTVYERRVFRACAELGRQLSDAQLASLSEASVSAWQQHVTLDPVALGVLSELRATYPLALVSNFDHELHVHAVLHETGLRPHFDSVVVSCEVGVAKPDPRIFERALAETGLSPEDVVYVGDDDVDVAAARGAGMQPVRIRREPDARAGSQRDGHDVVQICSLTELLPLLDR